MRVSLIIMLLISTGMLGQQQLEGTIQDGSSGAEASGLFGANVVWLNTDVGVVTDIDGKFSLPYKPEYRQLVISYLGYRTDTLSIDSPDPITHVLQESDDSLKEVSISVRRKASARSYLQAQNVINVSSAELLKAACCNLSESFETNPSIDVNFADAVTGTRQIKMLGLTSPYILIATENIPAIRGASQIYGLSFIPGTWVESIQITKGAGSVINGYESISGQINAELQKPSKDDRIFINAYGSLNGRLELNTHFNTKVSEKWDTGLYLHGNLRDQKFDRNNDGFLDIPLAQQINVLNRWQYTDLEKGWVSFLNVRFLNDEKQTGQENFDPDLDKLTTNAWGSEIDTRRFEASGKMGYVNPDLTYQSLGVQAAFSLHDQESYFGLNTYDITHSSWYTNAIYNSIIGDTRHKIKTGLSFTLDNYDELVNGSTFTREENSVGGFFEYAFDDLDKLSLTAGIRADNHNLLGFFLSPRLHAKYTPWDKSALRVSVGRGKRSANIFTENQQFFSSSRQILLESSGGPIYGLEPEIAWNYGISFLQGFNLFEGKADITLDYYRTDFQQQVVVDWEDPRFIRFYNLEGDSYANSFQAEFNYTPVERLDFRFAYKYYDVKTQYDSGKLERPLTPRNRIFANTAYETAETEKGSRWKFDLTYNWLDDQRFPSTAGNLPQNQRSDRTPSFGTLNGQITRVFSSNFEVYIGGENITDVRQDNPIIAADDPFGTDFDTTFVYGPIFGSMYYAGLRYKLN